MKKAAFILSFLSIGFQTMYSKDIDPFTKYLDSNPPTIVREISCYDSANVFIKEVVFLLKDSSVIYAIIATPKNNEKHPGILILHGGGGKAERDKAIAWAQRGYIAIAPDLPGIAEPSKLTFTHGRWNKLKYGAERYVANPDVTSSVIFDAVLTAMKSLYLLINQPTIDKSNIGVVGISWGGYMTTMVCGLAGDKVKAGFSVFGCGFYELTSQISMLEKMPISEREKWLKYLDAGQRAKNIKANFFIAGATNDFFFYPNAVQKTLNTIKSKKNQLFAPNVSHTIPLPGGSTIEVKTEAFVPTTFQPFPTPSGNTNWLTMEVPFMDYYLKGVGNEFPQIHVSKTRNKGSRFFTIESELPITSVQVYWSRKCNDVKSCKWILAIPTQIHSDHYQVNLSDEAEQWFVIATDLRPVTVSSELISKK